MKTYNKAARDARAIDWGALDESFNSKHKMSYAWQILDWCGCVIIVDNSGPQAYDQCQSCLGYGRMPIGLQELE